MRRPLVSHILCVVLHTLLCSTLAGPCHVLKRKYATTPVSLRDSVHGRGRALLSSTASNITGRCTSPLNHTALVGQAIPQPTNSTVASYAECCTACAAQAPCNAFMFCSATNCTGWNGPDGAVSFQGACVLLRQPELDVGGSTLEALQPQQGIAVEGWAAGAVAVDSTGPTPPNFNLVTYGNIIGEGVIPNCSLSSSLSECMLLGFSLTSVASYCLELPPCQGFVWLPKGLGSNDSQARAYLKGADHPAKLVLTIWNHLSVSPTAAIYMRSEYTDLLDPNSTIYQAQVFQPVVDLADALDEESGCVLEESTNYVGQNLAILSTASAVECCQAAERHPIANQFTYCPSPSNCDAKYYQFKYRQCNLRYQTAIDQGQWPFMYEQSDTLRLTSGLPNKTWTKLAPLLKDRPRPNVRQEDSLGCLTREHAVYGGIVLQEGTTNVQPSQEACCQSCRNHPQCNIWVYCPSQYRMENRTSFTQSGCVDGFTNTVHMPGSCSLKYQAPVSMVSNAPRVLGQGTVFEARYGAGPNITFNSGVVISVANISAGPDFEVVGFGDVPALDIACPGQTMYEIAWQGDYCRIANMTAEEVGDLCLELGPICKGFAYVPFGEGNSYVAWTPVAYLKGNVTWAEWEGYIQNNFTDKHAIVFYSRYQNGTEAWLEEQQVNVAGSRPPPPASPESSDDSNLALILGICIPLGVLATLGAALLALLIYRRRAVKPAADPVSKDSVTSTNKSSKLNSGKDMDWLTNGMFKKDHVVGGNGAKAALLDLRSASDARLEPQMSLVKLGQEEETGDWMQQVETLDWHVKAEEVEILNRKDGRPWILGTGAFSTVYKGQLAGGLHVAVKDLTHGIDSPKALEAFVKEVSILKSCRSPHIVQFIGACVQPNKTLVITELMQGGALMKALGHGAVTWYKRGARIALDVAQGLLYLHTRSPPVIHLDLKSPNVLLTETGAAKIGDVGLAHVMQSTFAKTGVQMQGTWAWMASEVLLGQKVTTKCDCYSFGVLLWEIVTGELPKRGALTAPQVPEQCPQEIAGLIKELTQQDADLRPNMRQVCERLRAVRASQLGSASSRESSVTGSSLTSSAALGISLRQGSGASKGQPDTEASPTFEHEAPQGIAWAGTQRSAPPLHSVIAEETVGLSSSGRTSDSADHTGEITSGGHSSNQQLLPAVHHQGPPVPGPAAQMPSTTACNNDGRVASVHIATACDDGVTSDSISNAANQLHLSPEGPAKGITASVPATILVSPFAATGSELPFQSSASFRSKGEPMATEASQAPSTDPSSGVLGSVSPRESSSPSASQLTGMPVGVDSQLNALKQPASSSTSKGTNVPLPALDWGIPNFEQE